jgi:hypothetical protein
MRLLNLTLAAATVLSAPIHACKCLSLDGFYYDGATEGACNELGGQMNGNDCVADSISEKLSDFRFFCQLLGGQGSDCSCPIGCREAITAEEDPEAVAAAAANKKLVEKTR